jgi:hypothetical protein
MNNRRRTRGRRFHYRRMASVVEKRPPKDMEGMSTYEWINEVAARAHGDRIGPPRFKKVLHYN